jgi:hypothetical protein
LEGFRALLFTSDKANGYIEDDTEFKKFSMRHGSISTCCKLELHEGHSILETTRLQGQGVAQKNVHMNLWTTNFFYLTRAVVFLCEISPQK